MIELITVEPKQDADHQRGHRLPYVASEILSMDTSGAMIDKMFESQEESAKKGNLADDDMEEVQKISTSKESKDNSGAWDSDRFKLLNHFMKFLQGPKPVNSVLAGYFCKLFSRLMTRKVGSMTRYLFDKDNKALAHMMEHIY